MLTAYSLRPTIATSDITRARAWYRDRLGMEPALATDDELEYRVGATSFTVFRSPDAGSARQTVMIIGAADLREAIARLKARGLEFADLDLGAAGQTDGGVLTGVDTEGQRVLNAWFQDADGNWISIVEQAAHPGEPTGDDELVTLMLPASDVARARAWYAERLGMTPRHELPGEELLYGTDATRLTIYWTDAAGTARHVVGAWHVPDLDATMEELRARGITVDESSDGFAGARAASFTDSEGNRLALVEYRASAAG